MLDLAQVRTLLLAERSRDVGVITEAVDAVLATSPEESPIDIEMVFRDAGSPVYLIGKPELTIVIGMPARRSALDRLGLSPQENRYALAGTPGPFMTGAVGAGGRNGSGKTLCSPPPIGGISVPWPQMRQRPCRKNKA